MGFEWQFGTEWRAGRAAANGEGPAEIVDGTASACKSAHGTLRESVWTGREHTDGSACGSRSARRDKGKRYEESK
jgi:hypothetical protein